MAMKKQGTDRRCFVMMGDGEIAEGAIWEAAAFASHYKLDNLVCILDYNKAQIDGYVKDVMNIEPIADKWEAFGWHVISIDGHDFDQIMDALDEARNTKGKPTFIIADTVKGKGVSFMENNNDFHGMATTDEQLAAATAELSD